MSPLSVKPAWIGFAHHKLCRRQHQFQGQGDRSAHRRAGRGALGKGIGRRSWAASSAADLRPCIWTSCWRLKGSTKAWTSKTTWWRCTALCTFADNPGRRIDRYASAWFPSLPACGPPPSRLGNRAGCLRQWKEKMEEFNREFNHSLIWVPWQRPGFELGLMMRNAVRRIPDAMGSCWADTASSPGARRSASAI